MGKMLMGMSLCDEDEQVRDVQRVEDRHCLRMTSPTSVTGRQQSGSEAWGDIDGAGARKHLASVVLPHV